MTSTDIWTYGAGDWSSMNVTGYKVEATDGDIGKVDDASYEVGAGYIVVDTGPWILGKKVMLPAGVISRVDVSEKKVHVDRTKDEIVCAGVRSEGVQGAGVPRPAGAGTTPLAGRCSPSRSWADVSRSGRAHE